MNKRFFQIALSESIASTRPSREAIWHQQNAGVLCSACKASLPRPFTSCLKYCANCEGKKLVVFAFYRNGPKWQCRFLSEDGKQTLKRVVYHNASKVRETAWRGNGILTPADQSNLQIAADIGQGRVVLRLSESQYRTLLRSKE